MKIYSAQLGKVKNDLTFQNVNYHFDPGDTIGIIPANNPDEINKLFNRLNLNQVADRTYNLSIKKNTMKKSLKIPNHVDHQSTLRNLFLNNLDIRGVPKKVKSYVLKNLNIQITVLAFFTYAFKLYF